MGSGRPPAWGKIRVIQILLRAFEEVLWIDADAAVVRFDADIGEEVPTDAHLGLALHHYFGMALPNTGVMYWRRTRRSQELLAEAWKQAHLIDHPYWEQAALLELMGYDVTHTRSVRMQAPTTWHDGVHYLGNEWNTTRRSAAERPRIIHCAGEDLDRRADLLADVCSTALRSPGGADYEGYPGNRDDGT